MPLIPLFVQNEVGADAANRASAFAFCAPFDHVLPPADSAISGADQQHLLGCYSGIAFSVISAQIVDEEEGWGYVCYSVKTLLGFAIGAGRSLFGAPAPNHRWVLDRLMVAPLDTSTATSKWYTLKFYDGNPNGIPAGPEITTVPRFSRCMGAAAKDRTLDIRDLGLRFNENIDVWLIAKTNMDELWLRVCAQGHSERASGRRIA